MSENLDKQFIAKEYQEFVETAIRMTDKDVVFPLRKNETKFARYEKHLIGMLEMYSIRFGDADERLKIVAYLEKQLIPWCGLSTATEIWDDIKKQILKGEYKDLTNGKYGE